MLEAQLIEKVNMKNEKQTSYKFRAECATDVQAIRAVLLPWLYQWVETKDILEFKDVEYSMPSMTVELSLIDGGPNLHEIQWLLDAIDNAHIAAETINLTEEYTGERELRRIFDLPATRPNNALLEEIVKLSRSRLQTLQLETERVARSIQKYSGALQKGNKWNPMPSDGSNPGYLLAVNGPVEGITQFMRITPPMGCKNWESKSDQYIRERMATIHA